MPKLGLWLLLLGVGTTSAEAASISGKVVDPSGAPVGGARASVLTAHQALVATAESRADGTFQLLDVPPGRYELTVSFPGFDTARRALQLGERGASLGEIALRPPRLAEEVTVTADLGRAEAVGDTPQQVNVVTEREVGQRAVSVLAEALQREVGVQLQRTSPNIAGVFIRGLTGQNVSVFVDGVRYSNAAQRGGINTFLGMVEPNTLRAAEVLRGPQGAQYGSASLGGSLQLLSRAPELTAKGQEIRGRTALGYSSADRGFFVSPRVEWAGTRAAVLVDLTARRVNTLRPGGGFDRHAAVTRFLGIPSGVLGGERLPDTAFTSYGGLFRLDWAPSASNHLSLVYRRNQADGSKRYDQLLGGDGNNIADLRNMMLDVATVRYQASRLGLFDTFSLTGSFNTQREERVNQRGNGDPLGDIGSELERMYVYGIAAHAQKSLSSRFDLSLGAELYDERMDSRGTRFLVTTGETVPERQRIPDEASYRSAAAWLQGIADVVPSRVSVTGALRLSSERYRARAADAPIFDGRPLWPDDSLDASDFAFRTGAVLKATRSLRLTANIARGFRPPSMTDLGTLGLSGAGFEVGASDLANRGAMVGSTAGPDAVSLGIPVAQLKPERSLSYEAHVQVLTDKVQMSLGGFVNTLQNSVVKQAVILPPGAVGTRIVDYDIVEQGPSGVVFVEDSTFPVLVRANLGKVRVQGIEQSLMLSPSASWRIAQSLTYVRAEDLDTGRPPALEGGTPAPEGWLSVRWEPPSGRLWAEAHVHVALRQDRLSSLDLQDRRIGAARSRTNINRFFRRGATVRGLVGPGPDGLHGTSDDVLLSTGETVRQVQDRVLGPGVENAPLFTFLGGYNTLDFSGGLRFGRRHEILWDVLNVTDRNFRGMSWGMPGPGRTFRLRYVLDFRSIPAPAVPRAPRPVGPIGEEKD